ncbi:hypothetical protein HNV12_25235 [Methanococcoides sp. SA1]|nr:hypothetical protein [Methanococcoides sp. SA1]
MPKKDIIHDQRAFSTTMDAIFFLTLISIATVILMPSIMAERQYDSAEYTTKQDFAAHILSSLLNSKMDTFDYEIEHSSTNETSSPLDKLITGSSAKPYDKQHNHRTFAEIIAEDLILTLSIDNSSTIQTVDPIARSHKEQTRIAIDTYLDKCIAGRYSYQLHTAWEPVEGYSLKSSISIGIKPPIDAVKQSSRVTLPTNGRPSKRYLLDTINDTTLTAYLNTPNATKFSAYHEGFNTTIDTAALASAQMIPHTTYPFGLNNSTTKITEQAIIRANQKNIVNHLKNSMAEEINDTVSQMATTNNINKTRQLRDDQIESIYNKINKGYVDITLSIW